MGFQFPNLTTFLSLMPQNQRAQVCWVKGCQEETYCIKGRMTSFLISDLPADKLHTAVTSWRLAAPAKRCRWQRSALRALQQLPPDTRVPGDCKFCKRSHSEMQTLCETKHSNRCMSKRSLCRWSWDHPLCPASGLWPSAPPSGQRSTFGLIGAYKTTWCSSPRVCSAPTLQTTLPVWPSKNCMTDNFFSF